MNFFVSTRLGRPVPCAQATSSNPDARKIEVEVELGGKGASFLVVRDNGGGMNASGLKDFATYFLTQVIIRLCIPV